MIQGKISIDQKALAINLDESSYGTFAEIGAGQEVARHFFRAGKASQTVAKTMSAYDMTVSDSIYGKEKNGRYVCEPRLVHMLDHEYQLVIDRLQKARGVKTRFFAFASTVAARTEQNSENCHGWLGVRFQAKPGGGANDLIIHVRMHDQRRLNQQQAIGIVGVNLLYSAIFLLEKPKKIVRMLVDYLEKGRIEIDMIRITGPDTKHINNRLLSIDLIRHGLTKAVIFSANGEVLQPSDQLFHRPIFVQRGTFRPITNTNILIQEKGLKQFLSEREVKGQIAPIVCMELTMQNLKNEGKFDSQDFLQRIDCINALGHEVLISDCSRFFDLKTYLRRHTNQMIGMVIGAAHLAKLFDPSYYRDLPGGILQAMGHLFDPQTRLYVYPYKEDHLYVTAGTYLPNDSVKNLYQHLVANRHFIDIDDCEDFDVSLSSANIRELMKLGNVTWEKLVPKEVRDLIKRKGYFLEPELDAKAEGQVESTLQTPSQLSK
mgnify:CR=1 FL=1